MGQVYGKAPFPQAASSFINLPRLAVYGLWDAFTDIAEGYSLSIDEFYDILKVATLQNISFDEKELFINVDRLFRAFDTDENRLVDSLEFVASLAMLSAMTPEEKLCFLFAMFDFEEVISLSKDEIVLAFRSCCSGLSKLSLIEPPSEESIEKIVAQAFTASRKVRMDREVFLTFCLNTPEISSWIEYFEDLEETTSIVSNSIYTESKVVAIPAPSPLDLKRSVDDRMSKSLPWENVIPLLVNSRLSNDEPMPPRENFAMDWVYGFNGLRSRQSVYYTHRGEVVYPAGAVVIIQNIYLHSQRHFTRHQGIVMCLKQFHTSDGRTIIATGEQGDKPIVHVWDSENLSVISSFQDFHTVGVSQLDFSLDRRHIITLGMDEFHCVAVYDWIAKIRLFSSRTTTHPVYDIRYISDDIFATCGYQHVHFWKETRESKYKYRKYRGTFGPTLKTENIHAISIISKFVVSGSDTGTIHIWDGRNVVKSIKAHDGIVSALYNIEQSVEPGLMSACDRGKINIWNKNMEITATFETTQTPIVSICWNLVTSKILVASSTCEIFEIHAIDGKRSPEGLHVIGHATARVSAVATHPFIPHLLCTISDDEYIRVFNSRTRRILLSKHLGTNAQCVTYSPDGQRILVCFGSKAKAGAYLMLSEEKLANLYEGRDTNARINDCKFTPNAQQYLLAGEDSCIYLYDSSGYKLKAHLRAHISSVINIDVSKDSNYLMSNDTAGHLYFWDLIKKEVVAPNSVREVEWSTNNCKFSFTSQKIWTLSKETNYNAISRSYDGSLLAAVTNHGEVRVFSAPCLKDDPPYNTLNGHGPFAASCQFSCDDGHLFSTGQVDGCLIQWRCIEPETNSSTCQYMKPINLKLSNDLKLEVQFEGLVLDHNAEYNDAIEDHPIAVCEYEETAGEASEEIMPWQKVVVPPNNLPIEDLSEPADSLDIEYVYGLTVDRSRSSLMYSPTGEILFFSAAIVVLMDSQKRTQRFYQGHRTTISAMTVTSGSNEKVVASGDVAENPTIRVWDPTTLQTLSVLSGFHTRAIVHLDFDASGSKLASVGQDQYHSIAVFDWKNQQIICSCQSFANKSFFMNFLSSGNTIIHGGHNVIRFYDIDGRNVLSTQPVNLPTSSVSFVCCEMLGHRLFIGTDNGSIYHFFGCHYDGVFQAHNGTINQITATSTTDKNPALCSCSADGNIKIWVSTPTNAMKCILDTDIANTLKSISSNIRTVYGSSTGHSILLATSNAEIFEISSTTGESLHQFPLTSDSNGPSTFAILTGHGGEELWGLSVNPVRNNEFCTVGDDCLLRVWDSSSHHSTINLPLELPARACCYSPDGKVIAIGYGCPENIKPKQYNGKWIIMDTSTWQSTHEARDSKTWITVIKYSSNGEFLAMGAFDNKIYVYNTSQAYALSAVINQHTSYITAIDFSDDGAWLQSNGHDHELCFFETDTGIFIPAASRLRDVTWNTQNCYMGWSCQGLWTPFKDGREPTTSESNYNHPIVEDLDDGSSITNLSPILVSGDNYGCINVYRYPCTSSLAHAKRYHVSSSPVHSVRILGAGFAASDSKALAIVGKDKSIIQFKHRRDASLDIASNYLARVNLVQIEEEEDDVLDFIRPPNGSGDKSLFPKPIDINPTASLIRQSEPENTYPLVRILGLQAGRCRGSLRYCVGSVGKNGAIIYPTSKYILIQDIHIHQQQVYSEHQNEVACLTVSKDQLLAASAEHVLRVRIHIWDATTGMNIIILPVFHRQGVSCLQFSSNRHRLISLGKDADYSIAIWESCTGHWQDGKLLSIAKGDVHPTLFVSLFHSTSDKQNFSYDFVSGGRYHVKFWKIEGRSCIPAYPSLPGDLRIGTMLCGSQVFASPTSHSIASTEKTVDNLFISGSTSGHFYVWRGRKCIKVIRAHEGGITSIMSTETSFFTGSKDGLIKIWNISWAENDVLIQPLKSYSLKQAEISALDLPIRSIDVARTIDQSQIMKLLIASAGGEVYEIVTETGDISLISEGHNIGEVWGLSPHPTDPDIFATCGDDRSIRLWSISLATVLCKAILECSARTIAWSYDGKWLVVGMGGDYKGRKQRQDGAFLILNGQTLNPIFEGRDSKQAIVDAAYSPDSTSLAIGSTDGFIYLYGSNNYRLRGKATIGNSIHSIDYSLDSRIVKAYSITGDVIYLDTDDATTLSPEDLIDVKWKGSSSLYEENVREIWNHLKQQIEITNADDEKEKLYPTTCDIKGDFIAAGTRGGGISILRQPSIFNKSSSQEFTYINNAHVGSVSKVCFTSDMKHLISVGAFDRTINIRQINSDSISVVKTMTNTPN